jgi:hypothetical protein
VELTAELEKTITRSGAFIREERKSAIEKKMQNIKPKQINSGELVHNLSDKVLTDIQITALSHEANFNTSDAKPVRFIAEFESILAQTPSTEDERNRIRQKISSLLALHKNVTTISRAEKEALDELKTDTDIIILPADKGRSTVVMNKTEYLMKIDALLSDREAYKTCDGDPMKKLTGKINQNLKRLRDAGAMSQSEWARIKPVDAALPRFYGLPKIHKDGNPLRPIVAYNGSPTHGLAKWLFHHLKHLVRGSPYSINSSTEFLDRINCITVEDDEIMLSFDVTSLFTSIPRDLAIETMRNLLMNRYEERSGGPKISDLIVLLEFCLTTYFTSRDTTYEQIKGTPMGSPISGFIAEAVLQSLEDRAFSEIKPKFWTRYVDDTFVIVKNNQKPLLTALLNSIFTDINFTTEEEANNQLPFLDVLIQKATNGTLQTSVYRKATNTLQIINFTSNHPIGHKISCIRTLFNRVKTHCNSQESKRNEIEYLRNLFRSNNYPNSFITKHTRNQPSSEPYDKPTYWRSLPYIKNVSEAAARMLIPFKVGIGHRPDATIRSRYMQPKDPLPLMENSSLVYKVNCSDCSANYIGETSKRLKSRLHEHQLAIRRSDPLSQMANHTIDNNHSFAFNEAKIIGRSTTHAGRLLQEAWFSDEMSINRHIDLPIPYRNLRHQIE